MAGRQRTRVHTLTDQESVGTNYDLIGTIDETSGENVHGLRLSVAFEPENADANCNGLWALWCLPRESTAIPTTTVAGLELEADNPAMWAVGAFAASNQTPYVLNIDLGTSRNCPNGTRVIFRANMNGVSAGNVRVTGVMRWFTKSL